MSNNNEHQLLRRRLVASSALPPIGGFLYLKHRQRFPDKAGKALANALAGIPVAIVAGNVLHNFILKQL